MDIESIFISGVLFFLSSAVISLLPFPKVRSLSYILSATGSVLFAGIAMYQIFGMPSSLFSVHLNSAMTIAYGGDALSGFFITAISILTCAVSIYSIGYTKDIENPALMGLLFNIFILSMYAVALSGNIITFLISWETMAVVSYFLVTFNRDEKSAKAGLVYAVMTHIGTAFIIAAFMILYKYTGSMEFTHMRESAGAMPDNIRNLVFIFSLIGFGAKAGIIPLHTWLPRAHPAAPSNISSLMSGVMIKTGIYGFIRIGLDVLGSGPEWWGLAVVIIGAVSSVLGILYAMMENDIKRLLAYSSVENIGIVLLGIGTSMIFRNYSLFNLSAVALIAGLYHILNHTVFKGLLFLGAGSVLHAAKTRNMEHLGGLMKAMPYTGLFFLIGSVSICALPPLNGFVSEWLMYQSLIAGFHAPSVVSKILLPLGGTALALAGALAAACFVKAFGISFLGQPRSSYPEHVHEVSATMKTGMGMLALLCLFLGIFPGTVIRVISPASFLLTGAYGVEAGKGFLLMGENLSSISPVSLIVILATMFLATIVFLRVAARKGRIKYRDAWDCGMPGLTPRMQYSSTAFTKPVRQIFRRIYMPKRDLKITYILKPFFVRSIQYRSGITPFIENYIYTPVTDFIHKHAGKIQQLQSGNLHLYLGYILITLIALLVFGT
ncbi:MAG: hydrogenase 4 subunit B [Nitrospiraceae bacterium]|nr:MAG: hydrogenase 4 subunit B [Nitrospiraceae bacterium]